MDCGRACANVLLDRDDVGWGPNNRFSFPSSGGTGEIYRRLAVQLGPHVHFQREVVEIDPDCRVLRFSDGVTEEYEALVSTMPLRSARRHHQRLPCGTQ